MKKQKIKKVKSIEEKINICLNERIKNLHPIFREELYQILLQNQNKLKSENDCKQLIYSLYKFPYMGKNTKDYWIARGWNKIEAKYKARENNKKIGSISPFSIKFWLDKINPETGVFYTEKEADYKRNSQRPIRKEYWLEKGYCEEESINLAKLQKIKNNKLGTKSSKERTNEEIKYSSPRCKEYYILRGYTEEEALIKVSEVQTTFSLDICIEKYGEEEGEKIWIKRQIKWKETLNSKSKEEKDLINRKKSTKINYKTLWNNELDTPCILYLLKIYTDSDIFYKIGITTRTIKQRYKGYKIGIWNFEIIKTVNDTVHKCFLLEQNIIKNNKSIRYYPNEKFCGWTECFINEPIIPNNA